MKKSKILSLVLALAMSLSLVPAAVNADSNVIYSENYDGKTPNQVATQLNGSVSITDGVLEAQSGGGIVYNALNAAVADAPQGKVRVKFDILAPGSEGSTTKAELLTNNGNVKLVAYGFYNCIRNDHESQTAYSMYSGDKWYTNDIVLDFINGNIIINVTDRATGEVVVNGAVVEKDLSGISTIKGIDLYGWAGTAKYDNMLIEYLPWVDPNLIYAESFNGNLAGYDVTNSSIVDGVLVAKTSEGAGGFNFASLNAEAKGKVRVKYDVKTIWGVSISKSLLKTNGANIPLVCYYFYEQIMNGENTGKIGTYTDVWYTNDIVLDFDNNKIIINVTRMDNGEKVVDSHEVSYDLSGINTIKGLDIFGWDNDKKADMYYDNFVIEYVTEEVEEPEVPEEPKPATTIWSDDYSKAPAYGISNGEIVDGVLRINTSSSSNAGGFNFDTLSAKAEGKVRLAYDVKVDNGNDVSKSELKTNAGNIPLVKYWYGGVREARNDNVIGSYGGKWYTNDIVIDFANNKIIINVTETESGAAIVANHEMTVDMSNVTTITGLDIYGWDGDKSADTYYDNFILEYVPEEAKEIEIVEVNMGDYAGKAWDVVVNEFDGEKTYTANFSDGEEVKSGEIDFSNVEADGGSVAFAIFLHTSRANVALDVVAQ